MEEEMEDGGGDGRMEEKMEGWRRRWRDGGGDGEMEEEMERRRRRWKDGGGNGEMEEEMERWYHLISIVSFMCFYYFFNTNSSILISNIFIYCTSHFIIIKSIMFR